MKRKKIQIYPLNRVEGDLEIHIEVEDNVVVDARSAGIMYRGFENLLVGRAPLDGLVLTPRVCGICCTSHLLAAAKSLDMFLKGKAQLKKDQEMGRIKRIIVRVLTPKKKKVK